MVDNDIVAGRQALGRLRGVVGVGVVDPAVHQEVGAGGGDVGALNAMSGWGRSSSPEGEELGATQTTVSTMSTSRHGDLAIEARLDDEVV